MTSDETTLEITYETTFEVAYSNDSYIYDTYPTQSDLQTVQEQLTVIIVLMGAILGVCIFRQLRK